MRTRNSLLLVLFLIILLIAVIVFFIFVVEQDRSSQQSSSSTGISAASPSRVQTYPEERQQSGVGPERSRMIAESCATLGVACASTYIHPWQEPADGSCHATMRNGYPVPDPQCTPGGTNSTVTLSLMQDAETWLRLKINFKVNAQLGSAVRFLLSALSAPQGSVRRQRH
jgi:hypothetical protein